MPESYYGARGVEVPRSWVKVYEDMEPQSRVDVLSKMYTALPEEERRLVIGTLAM